LRRGRALSKHNTKTGLRVYEVRTGANHLNQTANTGTILRMHDLNAGTIQVITFNGY
jgi:hypothetical protein